MKSYIIGRADAALLQIINDKFHTVVPGVHGRIYVIEARVLHSLFMLPTCPVPDGLLPDPDRDIAVYLTNGDNDDCVITWLVI